MHILRHAPALILALFVSAGGGCQSSTPTPNPVSDSTTISRDQAWQDHHDATLAAAGDDDVSATIGLMAPTAPGVLEEIFSGTSVEIRYFDAQAALSNGTTGAFPNVPFHGPLTDSGIRGDLAAYLDAHPSGISEVDQLRRSGLNNADGPLITELAIFGSAAAIRELWHAHEAVIHVAIAAQGDVVGDQ